jgi:hypothetical protein
MLVPQKYKAERNCSKKLRGVLDSRYNHAQQVFSDEIQELRKAACAERALLQGDGGELLKQLKSAIKDERVPLDSVSGMGCIPRVHV